MWNDVETIQDLLNFKIVADTAAQMIKEGKGQKVYQAYQLVENDSKKI